MSTLAKIFVVINLFLSLAFVGVCAALLAEKDNWKIMYENVSDQRAAEVSALEARAARLTTERDDSLRQYNQLYERYEETLREWERVRDTNKSLTESQARLEKELATLAESTRDIDEQIQQVSDENTRLAAEIRTREQERDSAREAQRQAEEAYLAILAELEAAEERLRASQADLASVQKDLEDEKLVSRDLRAGGSGDVVAPPSIDGKVVAVSADVPLVMLNVGKDDRVEEGYVFTVYRNDTYVAKVRVKDVFKDSCSAMVIPAYRKHAPREGDNVSTRIY